MESIEIECEFCKIKFSKLINEYNRCLKSKQKHFCSLSCSGKYSGKLKKEKAEIIKQDYYKNPKRCKTCNSAIDYFVKKVNGFFITVFHERTFSNQLYPGYDQVYNNLFQKVNAL